MEKLFKRIIKTQYCSGDFSFFIIYGGSQAIADKIADTAIKEYPEYEIADDEFIPEEDEEITIFDSCDLCGKFFGYQRESKEEIQNADDYVICRFFKFIDED